MTKGKVEGKKIRQPPKKRYQYKSPEDIIKQKRLAKLKVLYPNLSETELLKKITMIKWVL
jgi:hypothetical protein